MSDFLSSGEASKLDVVGLRGYARQHVAKGKGVSAMNRSELIALVTSGEVSDRVRQMEDKPITLITGSSKPAPKMVRKPKPEPKPEPATSPVPETKLEQEFREYRAEVASPTLHSIDSYASAAFADSIGGRPDGHGLGTAIDGIVDTDEDLLSIREAERFGTKTALPESVGETASLLEHSGYQCSRSTAAMVYRILKTKPVPVGILEGPAGTGKTFLAKTVAKMIGATLIDYSCVLNTRFEDLTIKVAPDSTTVSGISEFRGPIARAAVASWFGRVVLLLDEWDKTHHHADSNLYQLLQDGVVTQGRYTLRFNLKNVVFFLGSNAIRDLSEPLMRRGKMLRFSFLHPRDVMKALVAEGYGKHGQLHTAISLYTKTCHVAVKDRRMTKPATIQELRQFLDDTIDLGDEANGIFESLVYSNITKNDRAHAALIAHQKDEVDYRIFGTYYGSEPGRTLQTSAFGLNTAANAVANARHEGQSLLPRNSTKFKRMANDLSKAGAASMIDDDAYSTIVDLFGSAPSDDPTKIGAWEIQESYAVLRQRLSLVNPTHVDAIKKLADMGQSGEAVFECDCKDDRAALVVRDTIGSRTNRFRITQHKRGDEQWHVDFNGNIGMRVDFVRQGTDKSGKLLVAGGFEALKMLFNVMTPQHFTDIDAVASTLSWTPKAVI